jgi:hypothetical protein
VQARVKAYEQLLDQARVKTFQPGTILIPPGPRLGTAIIDAYYLFFSFIIIIIISIIISIIIIIIISDYYSQVGWWRRRSPCGRKLGGVC